MTKILLITGQFRNDCKRRWYSMEHFLSDTNSKLANNQEYLGLSSQLFLHNVMYLVLTFLPSCMKMHAWPLTHYWGHVTGFEKKYLHNSWLIQ